MNLIKEIIHGYSPLGAQLSESGGWATTTIAVIGATGTAGSRVVARLKGRGVAVVEIARAYGIDVVTGHGLAERLDGVEVVIDVSNPKPAHDGAADAGDTENVTGTLVAAARNIVGACASQGVHRLVALSIAGIEKPVFDTFPYYLAKRAAEAIVLDSPVPVTIVKSTQWHEFATNPAVITRSGRVVAVEDWLIQPIAADTVADVLAEAALSQTRTPRTITGPQAIRLPELVSRLLALRDGIHSVRAVQPALAALADGALLAPEHAIVLGPDVETWLRSLSAAAPGIKRLTSPDEPDLSNH